MNDHQVAVLWSVGLMGIIAFMIYMYGDRPAPSKSDNSQGSNSSNSSQSDAYLGPWGGPFYMTYNRPVPSFLDNYAPMPSIGAYPGD